MTDLSELAREMFDLKALKEELETQVKEVNVRLKTLAEREIPEAMENRNINKFSVPGVGTIYIQADVRSSVLKDDRERFYQWLRENGHAEVVQDYVFPQTLNAFVKERLENGETFPEFLKTTVVEVARLRRG